MPGVEPNFVDLVISTVGVAADENHFGIIDVRLLTFPQGVEGNHNDDIIHFVHRDHY